MDPSHFVLGTVQLGRPYGIANRKGRPSRTHALEILSAALRAGITTLDTAPYYGLAEDILGEFLGSDTGRRAQVVSKVGRLGLAPGAPPPDVAAKVRASVEASLTKLGLQRLSGLLVHYADELRTHPSLGEVFLALKEEGLAAKVGLSAYDARDVDLFLTTPGMELIQLPFSVLDQRLADNGRLARLARNNCLVHARSVFLQGLLFMDPRSLPARVGQAREPLRRLRSLSREWARPLDELAFAFARAQEDISTLVIGVGRLEHLERCLALLQAPPLEQGLMAALEEAFAQVDPAVVDPRRWTEWR